MSPKSKMIAFSVNVSLRGLGAARRSETAARSHTPSSPIPEQRGQTHRGRFWRQSHRQSRQLWKQEAVRPLDSCQIGLKWPGRGAVNILYILYISSCLVFSSRCVMSDPVKSFVQVGFIFLLYCALCGFNKDVETNCFFLCKHELK